MAIPADRRTREPSAERPVVLLVDDEPDILSSLASLVEVCLPQVRGLTASSGAEALEHMAAHDIDLLLTDYKMPGMDGLQLMAEAQRIAPGVPRVLITAFPTVELVVRTINEVGVDRVLVKPFKSDEVVQVIAALLAQRRARKAGDRFLAAAARPLRVP